MIKPESIDLASLPWLPLEEKTAFPKRASIYFAIDSLGNVQYIGRSVNTKRRWGNHHKYHDLTGIGGVRIAYLFVDSPELLPNIEKALIQWFQPPLNYIGNPTNLTRLKTERTKAERYKTSDIEIITRYNPEAVAVRIFLKEDERETLKEACEKAGTNMSHLMRALALQWLEQNESA